MTRLVATHLGWVDHDTQELVKSVRGLPRAVYWDRENSRYVTKHPEWIAHLNEDQSTKPKQDKPKPAPEPVVEEPEVETESEEDSEVTLTHMPPFDEETEKTDLIRILAKYGIEKDRRSSITTLRKLVADLG